MATKTKTPDPLDVRDLQVYDVHKAAELLDVNPETIREWCRKGPERGGLRATKGYARNAPWRIPATSIREWITRNYYNPAA